MSRVGRLVLYQEVFFDEAIQAFVFAFVFTSQRDEMSVENSILNLRHPVRGAMWIGFSAFQERRPKELIPHDRHDRENNKDV